MAKFTLLLGFVDSSCIIFIFSSSDLWDTSSPSWKERKAKLLCVHGQCHAINALCEVQKIYKLFIENIAITHQKAALKNNGSIEAKLYLDFADSEQREATSSWIYGLTFKLWPYSYSMTEMTEINAKWK